MNGDLFLSLSLCMNICHLDTQWGRFLSNLHPMKEAAVMASLLCLSVVKKTHGQGHDYEPEKKAYNTLCLNFKIIVTNKIINKIN